MNHSNTYSSFKSEFDLKLKKTKSLSITVHMGPDPDAFSSALSIMWYVKANFPKVRAEIFIEGRKQERESKYIDYSLINWSDNLAESIKYYDTNIFLDGGELSRFTRDPDNLDFTNKLSICIDHHPGSLQSFDLYLHNPELGSCAELISNALFTEDDFTDQKLAGILLYGILGDTGTFQYTKAHQSSALNLASIIVNKSGLSVAEVHNEISTIKLETFMILKDLTQNTQFTRVTGYDDGIMFTYISNDIAKKYPLDILKSGVSTYLALLHRNVEGFGWGFAITPKYGEQNFSISFRSLDKSVDVNEVAKKFDGGGHVNTSGGVIHLNPDTNDVRYVVDHVLERLKQV